MKVLKNEAQKSHMACELINSLCEVNNRQLPGPEQFLPEQLIVGGYFYCAFLFLK